MKKLLRFSLMALFAVLGTSGALADGVTFDFDTNALTMFEFTKASTGSTHDADFTETKSYTKDNFTVSVSANPSGTPNRIWGSAPALRMYGGTFTVSGSGIKKIEFTSTANKFNMTASTGEIEDMVWTGTADEVVFTIGGNTQLNKIIINGDENNTPTEGQTAETAITVDRALEIIGALADNGKTTDNYYVKGSVSELTQVTTSGATFMMSTLKCYKLQGLENKKIVNTDFIKANDEVVVYGILQKYIDKNNNNAVVPEVTSGYVYSVNGKTQDDSTNPEDAIQGGTVDNPLTVDQALAYINDFPAAGFTTTKQYYVTGTVSSDPEISTENGNATFDMSGTSGTLTIFRVKGLENNRITKDDYVKKNDAVIILAKLQKYVKDDATTPEMKDGYIYSLNGNTTEPETPVEFEGDGTQDNPYTVGDLKQMKESTYPTEEVWVKGVIIGSAASATTLKPDDDQAVSNIAIAALTRADAVEFIPVKLDAGSIFRTELNVKDNPGNIGEEVLLKGKVGSYFSATGVTNLSVAVFKGETLGIQNLTIDADANAPMYNLKGERVDANYRGVVIKAGKKTIQK